MRVGKRQETCEDAIVCLRGCVFVNPDRTELRVSFQTPKFKKNTIPVSSQKMFIIIIGPTLLTTSI